MRGEREATARGGPGHAGGACTHHGMSPMITSFGFESEASVSAWSLSVGARHTCSAGPSSTTAAPPLARCETVATPMAARLYGTTGTVLKFSTILYVVASS